MAAQIGALLIPDHLVRGWGPARIAELAKAMETTLQQPVEVCFPDGGLDNVIGSLRALVASGVRRIVALPFGVTPLPKWGAITEAIVANSQEFRGVHFHAAEPVSWMEWSGWLNSKLINSLEGATTTPAEVGALLVAESANCPLNDADIPRFAFLMASHGVFRTVEFAFILNQRPSIAESIQRLAAEGIKGVAATVLSMGEQPTRDFPEELEGATASTGMPLFLSTPTPDDPDLVQLLLARHAHGRQDDLFQRELELFIASSAWPANREMRIDAGEAAATALADLDRRLNSLLPPEYQGKYDEVQPTSMGTAGLKFDSQGQVAWDEIWTSFCDLALAGGPPHRGTLLEAVTSEEVASDPEAYRSVVKEIERGIRMVTGLPLITSRTRGWVGVICESEAMAVWLMRAIIVENVMVRREGDILYLPAGPKFTLKREIKNVITAIAKTVHYWKAHLNSQRRSQ